MSNTSIMVSKIGVDVCRNDPVDVRAGGPEWLGFDFYVDEKLTDEMIQFIRVSLNHLGLPLASIGVIDTLAMNVNEVWDKKKILESLNKEADYLKEEASRNYPAYSSKK